MRKALFLIAIIISTVFSYSAEEVDYFSIARNELKKGNIDKALENFETASRKPQAKPEVFLLLGKTAHGAMRYQLAYSAFSQVFPRISSGDRKDYYFIAAESAAFIHEFPIAEKYLAEIHAHGIRVTGKKIDKLKSYILYKKEELRLLQKSLSNTKDDILALAKFYKEKGLLYLATLNYLKAFAAGPRKDPSITNELALFFLNKGNHFLARKLFLKSLEGNAFDRTANYRLGKMYFEEGNFEESANMFKRMRQVDNSYIPYLYLGEIYANTSGARFLTPGAIVTEAINFLKEAEKRGARSERLYTLLSYLYRNTDETQYKKYSRYARIFRTETVSAARLKLFRTQMQIKRLQELAEVFKNDRRSKDILYNLAKAYNDNEQYLNAQETIRKVLKIDKTNFNYYNISGFSNYKLNDIEKAIKDFNTAKRLNPRSGFTYYYLSKIYSIPEYLNSAKQIQFLKLSVQYEPDNVLYLEDILAHYKKLNALDDLKNTYTRLIRLGKRQYQNDLQETLKKIRLRNLEKDFSWGNDFEDGLKEIIELRLKLNANDPAVEQYLQRAKEKEKFHREIKYYSAFMHYNRFCASLKEQYLEKSISTLKELIGANPYYSDAYYLLSITYLYGKLDTAAAKEVLLEYEKRSTGYDKAEIHNLIEMINTESFDDIGEMIKVGYAMYKRHNSFYSLDYLNRAHKKDPKNKRLLLILGEIYKQKGDYVKAIYYYKLASELGTWNPEVFLALGNAYFAQYLNSPLDYNDFQTNYNRTNSFPQLQDIAAKLKEILHDTRLKAIAAYRIYIQQRTPFVFHELNPINQQNLVNYLERLDLNEQYLNSRIGFFFLRQNKTAEAAKIFAELESKYPDNRKILVDLLRYYRLTANDNAVLTTYERLVKLFKNDFTFRMGLGEQYYKLKQYNNALEHFKEAYQINKHFSAELAIARTLYASGNQEEAGKHYLAGISKLNVNERLHHPEVFFNLAAIKRSQGELKEALAHYEEALAGIKQNTFTDRFIHYKNMLAEIYQQLSSINLYAGRYREAFNWLIEARIFDPANRYQYDNLIGDILLLNSRFRYAITYYKNALKLNSTDPKLYYKIAVCYSEINQPRRALKLLQRLDGHVRGRMETEPLLLLGDIYLKLKDYSSAYSTFMRAYSSDRKNYKVYIKLAEALKYLRRTQEAVTTILNNIYDVHERTNLYSFLAWYMTENNMNTSQAILWAKKAALEEPENLTSLKTLAFLHYKTGDILSYFRVLKKVEKLNNELNTIATDYFNYLYDYKKSCAFFKNKEHLRAAAQFYNKPDLMKLKPQVDAYRASISNR